MKNKKYLVSLFVLVALLCLGIGYAAISKTLTINGGVATGEAKDLADNFILYFTKVDIDTTLAEGTTVTANVNPAAESLSTIFKIENMNKVGSKVVLIYTVKNASEDLYANSPKIMFKGSEVSANEVIPVGEVYQADPHFTIKVTPNMVNGQAAPNSTHTITIEVEMTNSPLEKVGYDFTFYLVYDACEMAYSG